MSWDFDDAEDFIRNDLGTTPEGFLCEVEDAMHKVTLLRNKRNKDAVSDIYHALLTCADLVERMIPATV